MLRTQKNASEISIVIMTMLKKILFLLITTFPLSLTAEEIVISGSYIPEDPFLKYNTKLKLRIEPKFDYNFCDKNPTLCKKINDDKFRFPKFDIHPRATKTDWAMFWTLQTLDILTTAEGLRYDCVKEINPLLPERPSTTRLVLHKGIIFSIPMLIDNDKWKDSTRQDLLFANLLTGAVVLNNLEVVDRANKSCSKY